MLQRRNVLIFLGIWLAITLVSGATGVVDGSERVMIAWEAHVGGFLAGLAAFYALDPGPVRA
jgi:membrane associated rhomboid family serine protease